MSIHRLWAIQHRVFRRHYWTWTFSSCKFQPVQLVISDLGSVESRGGARQQHQQRGLQHHGVAARQHLRARARARRAQQRSAARLVQYHLGTTPFSWSCYGLFNRLQKMMRLSIQFFYLNFCSHLNFIKIGPVVWFLKQNNWFMRNNAGGQRHVSNSHKFDVGFCLVF